MDDTQQHPAIESLLKPRDGTQPEENKFRPPTLSELKAEVESAGAAFDKRIRQTVLLAIHHTFSRWLERTSRSPALRKSRLEKGPHLRVGLPELCIRLNKPLVKAIVAEFIKGTEWVARLKNGDIHLTVRGTDNETATAAFDPDDHEEVVLDEDDTGFQGELIESGQPPEAAEADEERPSKKRKVMDSATA